MQSQRSNLVSKLRELGHHGFSLVEILVVMAIITILAAMLLPWLHATHEKARRTKCLTNLKQIGLALRMYSGDNGEQYPSAPDTDGTTLESFGLLTNSYLRSYGSWLCPTDTSLVAGSPTTPFTADNVSYAYNGFGLSEKVQADTPLVADRSNAIGGGGIRGTQPYNGTSFDNSWTHKGHGGHVLFAGGHAQFVRIIPVPMYNGKNP